MAWAGTARTSGCPTSARGSPWILRFESANYRATVWLNGRQVGEHAGGYLPFEVPLQRVKSGVNRLVVRIDSRRLATDLPPGGAALRASRGAAGGTTRA